jgi:hypothetical protein
LKFDPESDPDVAAALVAAVAAGVPRSRIERELVEAVTLEPQDELTAVILAGRLYQLARASR